MRLPKTTGVKVVRALKKAGFEVVGVPGEVTTTFTTLYVTSS